MSQDLTISEPKFEIQQSPEQVIDEASKAAKMLVDLVRQNGWSKKIGGGEHLQVEAWQVVGKFYGLTAKTKSTEYVEYGKAKGFNATVEIINDKGVVIGGAESMCLDDEGNWRGKPLFSIKSMAQTRATGKALRQMLSWVVVLAGFKPTPAEEMDHLVDPAAEAIKQMREAKRNPYGKEDDWIEGAIEIIREVLCETCQSPISQAEAEYSQKFYAKHLCRNDQKKAVKIA